MSSNLFLKFVMKKRLSNIVYFIFIQSLIIISTPTLLAQNLQDSVFINSDNIVKHTYFLGSDRLEGRGTGTPGEAKAADYISHLLHEYGLIPIGDRISYFQNIPMHGSKPLRTSRLVLTDNNEEILLKLGEDYQLYKTGAETFIPNPIPLVFVGYGIIAPEYDYNDYLGVDVLGKVVVFLTGEPYSEDELFFNGRKSTIYSTPEAKQRIALSRGARGSIMVPIDKETDWEYWVQEFAFEHVSLTYTISSHLSVLINPNKADKLFNASNHSFQNVIDMHKNGMISSFELNKKTSFNGEFEERDFISQNVVGLVNGDDDQISDSYILLSAHYDHLGVGPTVRGDSIYNGVLDNALGVATLLEITRVFSKSDIKTRRSIIVLFLTGEERGLLGSTYYTDNPIVPLYKTIANINIDGVAAFNEFMNVIGIGADYSSLGNELDQVLDNMGLSRSQVPREYFNELKNINRSDQFAFMKAGIPSVLITEGLNYKNIPYSEGINRMMEWNQSIYHSPFDDLNQNINFRATKQHAEVIYEFAKYLANSNDAGEWKPGSPFVNARLQSIAEKR
jgi:hypothetical protein